MEKEKQTIMTQVLWHEITMPPNLMPDDEMEVLVYDGYSDLVVIGYVETDGDDHAWIDATSQLPINDPQWWAEMPCPLDSPSIPL